MDQAKEEPMPDVFSDEDEEQIPVEAVEEEEGEEEEDEDREGEDAKIFDEWMQQYRGGDQRQEKIGEVKEEEEEHGEEQEGIGEIEMGRPVSRCSVGSTVRPRSHRRASLPGPMTLLQLSRLHSSTRAPVAASVLLRRSSSRRLLQAQQEASIPVVVVPERRTSLVPTIPETKSPEKRGTFRRRNVMSLSDAYTVCLICHNDMNQGSGGNRELECTHTFHKECIEEWLWRKQSCPTCHVQVSMPQPLQLNSTRVKVP